MKLHPWPFKKIKSGKKKFEIRLNDRKRKKIRIGDFITFSKRPDFVEKIKVKVKGRRECLNYPRMSRYYSAEEQKKYGFVVFNIQILKEI